MTEATKNKRLHTDVDAGYIGFSAKAQGHTLHRKLDEEATAAAGFETAAMEPDQCIEAVLIGGIEIQMHPVGAIGDIFGDAHGRTSFLASFGG